MTLTSAPPAAAGQRAAGRGVRRRTASVLARHPRLRLGLFLSAPVTWLVVAYLGSLALLFLSALWSVDDFTGALVKKVTFANFRELWQLAVYRRVALRTLGVALAVTAVDALIAVPVAFYMAKVASLRARRLLLIAVLTPLWSSYLVKVYAWRIMFSRGGMLDDAFGAFGGHTPAYGVLTATVVLAYLWLPYMILPVFAALDRLPNSLLEASADLGGRAARTFRRVVLPVIVPGIIAGSIFTFSLTLGDYIVVTIVGGKTQFIGNVVAQNVGAANNLPFAAAFALVPVAIVVAYLLAVRRTGALEDLS